MHSSGDFNSMFCFAGEDGQRPVEWTDRLIVSLFTFRLEQTGHFVEALFYEVKR